MSALTRTVIPDRLTVHVGTPGKTGLRRLGTIPRDTEVELTGQTYTDSKGTLWAEGTTAWSRTQTPVLRYWMAAEYLAGDQPAASRTAAARDPLNEIETRAWFKENAGRLIDMDGFPLGREFQCVDIPKHHFKHVLGGNPGTFGNGKDVAYNLGKLPEYTYYAPGTTRVQAADVVSFGKPLGQIQRSDGSILDAGHVGICLERVSDSTVAVADQYGYTDDKGLRRSEYPMAYITGIARPIRYAQED